MSGIWFSAGIFGCSWKVVSSKFQQINMSKPTFVVDSDDELNNGEGDDEEDDISVDNDVIAKISQKPVVVAPDKKTVVEKPKVSQKVVPSVPSVPPEEEDEEEDDDEEEEEDEGEVLEHVEEGNEDEEDDVPPEPVKVVEEPVKPAQESKVKKSVQKKK